MRPLLLAAAAALLAGCQAMEVNAGLAAGTLRVEPHPVHADSVRFTTLAHVIGPDPLGRNTPEGPRNSLVAVLGKQCRDAPMIEEGRVDYAPAIAGVRPRTDIIFRVVCPAALARPAQTARAP